MDGRTGEPVAHAEVTAAAADAAGVTATTDAEGRFTLRNVARRALLRVTSRNYRPFQARLTGRLLGIALDPIPVRGVVTSRLTSMGLRATVGAAGTEQTAADGHFEVYGVGPGEKLTVMAPGYRTALVTVDGDRDVRVALAAERATRIEQVSAWLRGGNIASVWRYVFRTPKGYEYVDLPADFKADVGHESVVAGGSMRRFVEGFDMRSVIEGDVGADIEVLAFAIDPGFAAQPGFRNAFVARFARNAGISPRSLVLARGATAAYFRPPDGAAALLFNEGPVVMLLFGPPDEPLERFARAFLTAHE